jgi:hypothetical protein
MVAVKLGYYVQGTGDGDVYHYLMIDEPPLGQFMLRGDEWQPLVDGFYLMDKIIDGDPDVIGPMANPPAGVPELNLRGLTGSAAG